MSLFVLHFSLTLFWVMLIGHSWQDFAVGFVISTFIVIFGDNFWYADEDAEKKEDSDGVKAEILPSVKPPQIYPFFLFKTPRLLREEFRLIGWFLARTPAYFLLILFFIWELLRSTFEVMRYVINYKKEIHPAIIEVALDCQRDFEVILLSSLITLSPGTLTVDERFDEEHNHRYLYVHVLNMTDYDESVKDIKKLEHLILKTLRGRKYTKQEAK